MAGDCNTDAASSRTSSQEALASAKWIYSNTQRTENFMFRLELSQGVNPNEYIPEPGRFDEQSVHLRAHNQHQEIIQKFKKDLKAAYGPKYAMLDVEAWRRSEEAEGDERKEPETEESWEILALEWISRSHEERMLFGLGYSAPWERLHPDSPGPFLSLGTHFWALIIGNDNYLNPSERLSGCINDAHLDNDYLMKYLQVPKDHIVLLEDASRNEMIDALYNLRDNEKIMFGDNILIHYSGCGRFYESSTLFQGNMIEAICPVDSLRDCREFDDISERELDVILSELSTAKGPKITFISDSSRHGSGLRSCHSSRERIEAPFRAGLVPPDDGIAMIHMLKLGMENPRRRSDVDIFSEKWERDPTSFVKLLSGFSSIEMDTGLGMGKHGLFTLAVIKVLESEEARGATYEDLIQIIGRLTEDQTPKVFGTRKGSLLWFRDSAGLDG